VKKARAVLRHAQACDMDVTAVREKWAHQEPE
jgi:citrate lyase subunit beta-like protein